MKVKVGRECSLVDSVCLACSKPQVQFPHHIKPELMRHACNPSTWEVGTGKPEFKVSLGYKMNPQG